MKGQSKRSIIEKIKNYVGCAPKLINTTNKRYPCTTTNIEKKFMFSFFSTGSVVCLGQMRNS